MSNFIKLRKSSASKQTHSRDTLSIKAFTIGYIAIFVLLAVGFPAPYSGTHIHIPFEYLPMAIGIAFIFYVLLLGLMLGIDRIKRS
jgi:hypothetical protein